MYSGLFSHKSHGNQVGGMLPGGRLGRETLSFTDIIHPALSSQEAYSMGIIAVIFSKFFFSLGTASLVSLHGKHGCNPLQSMTG